jgi:hypothetical protein
MKMKRLLQVLIWKIALDHLAEIPDYYTRLAAMEAAARPI